MKGEVRNSVMAMCLLLLLFFTGASPAAPALASGSVTDEAQQLEDSGGALPEQWEEEGLKEEGAGAASEEQSAEGEEAQWEENTAKDSEQVAWEEDAGGLEQEEEGGDAAQSGPEQNGAGIPGQEEPGSAGDTGPEEDDLALGESSQKQPAVEVSSAESFGNWTSYNGVIFEDATIYQSQSGGGLAVGGAVTVRHNFRVGSTYSSEYDPTLHIGEYKNEDNYPALLLAGETLSTGPAVDRLEVFGGPITMSPQLMEINSEAPAGFTPGTDSFYQTGDSQLLKNWFAQQYNMAQASSKLMLLGNEVSIDIAELGNGAYLQAGQEAYRNRYFEVNGKIHETALFITVRSGSDLNLGQWWPVHSVVRLDANWAIDNDLVVFNFPDAVNVTMNSSTFQIDNMQHWSTTVDAWVGERGMEERLALAEKVVYNFPNARSIEADQALIQGTILAPNASFTGIGLGDAGHLYGHIVAKRYVAQGNFTIHAFSLTPWIYDLVEDALSQQKERGSIRLRHYLYFNGEPTAIRAQGGGFLLESEEGFFFDGVGGLTADIGNAAVYTTTVEGYTEIENVPLGGYTLVNTQSTDGFVLNDSDPENPYTYARHPVSVEQPGAVVQAVRYSEPAYTDLYFKKVDEASGEGLPGAVFTIVRERDAFQDATAGETYASGEDGGFVSRHVPAGTYHLVEIEPPPGHGLVAGGEVRFSVIWDEQLEQLVVEDMEGRRMTATAEKPLEIPNSEGVAGNTVMLIKYARDADEPESFQTLSGAGFSLYRYNERTSRWERVEQDATGAEVDIVTNEFGYYRINHLPDGVYRVAETSPPPGYALTNRYEDPAHPDSFPTGYAYEFTFSDAVSFYTAYIPNKPLAADITVAVSGLLLGERQPLNGSLLRLEHLLDDGRTWEEWVDSASVDETGEILLEGLTVGSYRLTQLQAVKGFELPDPAVVLFSVAFDSGGNPVVEALHNGLPVGEDTVPVRLEDSGGIRIHIHNDANACDYCVYKIDGDYTVGKDDDGNLAYQVNYLEHAELRLRRRTSTRTLFRDYGAAFVSEWQYTQEGLPLLDSYGNHIAAAYFEGGLLYGEYQLVETHPPEGFHPNSNVEVVMDDGAVGYQLHLFTVTEEMAASRRMLTYTATDYADRHSMPFRFRLVDGNDGVRGIGGAEFALYHCGEQHVHSGGLTGESCWAKSTPVIAASGPGGAVFFENLESGDYLLRQDGASPGYRLPNALWLVTLDAKTETITTELLYGAASNAFTNTGVEWLLPNWKSFALPVTGGGGTVGPAAAGVILIAAAATIKLRKGMR